MGGFALAVAMAVSAPAEAGNFGVEPIRVELLPGARSQLLEVTSHADTTLRIQVQAFAWVQKTDGQPSLTPTKAVTVFPSLLTLKPRQSRKVRVAIKTKAGQKELTYRLIVAELPGKPGPKSLNFLVRMSVPIYQKPAVDRPAGLIAAAALTAGALGFEVKNTGNVHFLGDLWAQGRDKKGVVVFEKGITGQVVLEGVGRRYSIPVPPKLCPQIHTVTIKAGSYRDKYETTFSALAKDACKTP